MFSSGEKNPADDKIINKKRKIFRQNCVFRHQLVCQNPTKNAFNILYIYVYILYRKQFNIGIPKNMHYKTFLCPRK